jgi:uncharacterized protein (TIGR04255 family)
MGTAMKNAPVYFTIAQVRFNPILSLASYVPKLQEYLRRNRFPDFKKGIVLTFNLAQPQQQAAEEIPPTSTNAERYHFANLENTKSFILEHGSLALQATEYETFEKFSSEFLEVIEVLNETVSLSFVERIGLRYLDAVVPRDGETLSQYLMPQVMGLVDKLPGKVQHSFSETLAQSNECSVMCRTVIQEGQVGFPPDLLQLMSLQLAERFTFSPRLHAIIDTDVFLQKRTTFDLTAIKKILADLHNGSAAAFRAATTEHALAVWA